MVKKLIFILAVCFLLVQVISAVDTEIKVKTLPYHEVQVSIMDFSGGSSSTLQRFINNSDEYGDIDFVYTSDELEIDLIVFIKKDDERVIHKQYKKPTGEPIYIELASAGFEFIETPVPINETLNATINNSTTEEINATEPIIIEENATADRFAIAGFTVFGDEGFLSRKTICYFFGVIISLAIIFVCSRMVRKNLANLKKNKVKDSDDTSDKKKEKIMDKKEIIEDAEKKIKEAQEEIDEIKKGDKIKEARRKIVEDEKELIRLREEKKD